MEANSAKPRALGKDNAPAVPVIRAGLAAVALCIALLAVLTPTTFAQSNLTTPTGVVQALYAAHARSFAKRGPGVMQNVQAAQRYFTPDLAKALVAKDLSFDPLYNGQDAKITELTIRAHPKLPSTRGVARLLVSFRNFGKPDQLTFILFRTGAGVWRINNIAHKDWQLRKLLKLN